MYMVDASEEKTFLKGTSRLMTLLLSLYRLRQLERHRASELARMRECFASSWYHDARRRFVYKVSITREACLRPDRPFAQRVTQLALRTKD